MLGTTALTCPHRGDSQRASHNYIAHLSWKAHNNFDCARKMADGLGMLVIHHGMLLL